MKTFLKQTFAQQLVAKFTQMIESGQWSAGMKVPAIREVASEFEVGLSTAYQALRTIEESGLIHRPVPGGLAYVKGERGRRLKSAASYTPTVNHVESAAKNRSHIALIGTSVPSRPTPTADDWNARIVESVEHAVLNRPQSQHQHHYLTRITSTRKPIEKFIDECIEQIRSLAPDISGAVVLAANHPEARRIFNELDALNIPWVCMNRPELDMTHNFVSANNLAAGRLIGRCFTLMGFERVMLLSPDLNKAISWTQKFTGLIDAYLLNQKSISGIEFVCVEELVDPQAVIQALGDYIVRGGPPQAIFATGDKQAMAAIVACQQHGLRVPEDVVVVGSTGVEAAAYTRPSLSLVTQPTHEMGQQLMELLFEMMSTGARRCPGKEITGELIIRESMPVSPEILATLKEEGLLSSAGFSV